jgi:uncharacterized protein
VTRQPARRSHRPRLAFGLGAGAGLLGGLIGLGGAEFRLPVLVAALRFSPRDAAPINLAASFAVLAAALPARLPAVPLADVGPHLPALLGMLAGSVSAAWLGAGWVRRLPERALGQAIVVLLVILGIVLVAEGIVAQEPVRRVAEGWRASAAIAALCGIGIGLVSSLLGVAGGELIIPVFILLFGVDAKLAGSMSILVGLPTIAAGLIRWISAESVLSDRAVRRHTLLPLAGGSVFGAVVGGLLLGLVPASALKIGLGIILIWSATRIMAHLPRR